MNNPFNPGYYTSEELSEMDFQSIGDNVMIAKNCTIIGLHNITVGDNVRIDGPTVITAHNGFLKLGSYIHIAGFCFINCAGGVEMEDFSGLSQGVKVYSGSDDYSGKTMTNPTVPESLKKVTVAPVKIKKHVIVGSETVVLPNVTIGEGVSVGALSLVRQDLDEWGIYVGVPAKRVKDRSRGLLALEAQLKEAL